MNSSEAVKNLIPVDSYHYAENPSQAGKDFSADGKRIMILCVFVSSWWIGAGFTTKAQRGEESPGFIGIDLLGYVFKMIETEEVF